MDMSNIQSGARMKAPRVLLYGVNGIGKTTFPAGDSALGLRGAPNPIFLFTEEGSGVLDTRRFEARPGDMLLRSYAEVIEALDLLIANEHPYETVVIDTIDELEPLIHQATCWRHNKRNIEAFKWGAGYRFAVDEARLMTTRLDRLRDEKSIATVLIGHEKTTKFEPPDAESYDKYSLRVHYRLAGLLQDWADAILFAKYKTFLVKSDEGFNRTRTRARDAVGESDRSLWCTEQPWLIAKNRFGLPQEIGFSWQAFEEEIARAIAARATPQ